MPKFTLIKHRDTENDAEVSVTFSTDELGLANDHFNDFLRASGFELPLDESPSDYIVRSVDEWEWNDESDDKSLKKTFNEAMLEHRDFTSNFFYGDVLKFPNRFDTKND